MSTTVHEQPGTAEADLDLVVGDLELDVAEAAAPMDTYYTLSGCSTCTCRGGVYCI